jgi:DNA polymerase-3 subunit gamma/tau
MFGLTGQSQLLELARTLLAGEVQNSLRQLNQLAENGKDLGRLLSDLLSHFRNLLIFQVSGEALDLLEVSEAEASALQEQSKMASAEALTRILDVFTDAETRLREAVSKRILVEVTLLKAIEARQAVSLEAVLGHLTRLRNAHAGQATSANAVSSAKSHRAKAEADGSVVLADDSDELPGSALASPIKEQAPITGPVSELAGLWPSLVEAVGRASPFVRSYLLEAHPVSFANGLLVIGFDSNVEEHIGLVDNARNHTLLQGKLAELGHPNSQIKFVKAEAAAPCPPAVPESAATPAPQPRMAIARSAAPQPKENLAPIPFNKDDFKNDPLIQKALEIFKAQIVEVRA